MKKTRTKINKPQYCFLAFRDTKHIIKGKNSIPSHLKV